MKAALRILRPIAAVVLASSAARLDAFETVVIDPGHGGNDEGTEWRHVSEKDLTLAVARRVEKLLKEKRIPTLLTRHADAYVSLDERIELANLIPESLLLSIHFNGSPMSDIRGFEIFAFRASPTSRLIAESIQQYMAEKLPGRNRGLRTDQDYAVLARSVGSSVLVECGFISNKAEAARLSGAAGQQALAEALVDGILRLKPLINTDPPEADLVRCEIHLRRHEEAQRKNGSADRKSSPPKKPSASGGTRKKKTGNS